MTPYKEAKGLIKHLYKHAQKDDCYKCKILLREMGLDPTKNPDKIFFKDRN